MCLLYCYLLLTHVTSLWNLPGASVWMNLVSHRNLVQGICTVRVPLNLKVCGGCVSQRLCKTFEHPCIKASVRTWSSWDHAHIGNFWKRGGKTKSNEDRGWKMYQTSRKVEQMREKLKMRRRGRIWRKFFLIYHSIINKIRTTAICYSSLALECSFYIWYKQSSHCLLNSS